MKCDIIIPVWNQPEVTGKCIDSINRNTHNPYRLVIIDNGSAEPTARYLKGLASNGNMDVLLIRNAENAGFIKAVNQGIKSSDAEYLCVMNNDTIATDGWLEEMVSVMEKYPDIGLLNPSSNTSGQFPGEGERPEDYATRLNSLKGDIQELYTCRGFCMLMRKEVVAAVGLLDEIYHLGYFDDADYCRRAQAKGFRAARAKGAYVYHMENTSFKGIRDNAALFKNNERLFFERWGRPLKVGYFVKSIKDAGRIDDIAKSVVRQGHQILIFLKRGLAWPVRLDHFDIRRFDIGPAFFGMAAVYTIFKRRNKKGLDIILTDDIDFGRILEAIKRLHGSDVYVLAQTAELMEALHRRSYNFQPRS